MICWPLFGKMRLGPFGTVSVFPWRSGKGHPFTAHAFELSANGLRSQTPGDLRFQSPERLLLRRQPFMQDRNLVRGINAMLPIDQQRGGNRSGNQNDEQ